MPMPRFVPVAFALLCFSDAGLPAAGSTVEPDSAAVEACLRRVADEADFSGVLSISRGGEPLVSIARGVLAGPGSAPLTQDARFNLASVGKIFTAVAVLQLADAGKLRLDDQVGKFVSGLTPAAAAVTVRQLLDHSSGLGDFFKPENIEAVRNARSASDLLPLVAHDAPAFAPGSKFAYSNSGFLLLGILVERVSGEVYAAYLRRHVFDAAGMRATGFDPYPTGTLAVAMTRHALLPRTPGELRQATEPKLASGGDPGTEPAALRVAPGARENMGTAAGGVFSTTADLQRFAAALQNNSLVDAKTTAAMTTPQVVAAAATAAQPERDYGFGFGVGHEEGHPWFGHNGGMPGGNAEFAVFPDLGLVFVVLANRDPPAASRLYAVARDLLLRPATKCPGDD